MRILVRILSILVVIFLASCGPAVPVIDINKVPPETYEKALRLPVFTIDSPNFPPVSKFLGEVSAYSCKRLNTDPPASKGNALTQLRINAFDQGATGVINVTFDVRGTDTWGTRCWGTVQATGIAVIFKNE